MVSRYSSFIQQLFMSIHYRKINYETISSKYLHYQKHYEIIVKELVIYLS